LKSYWFQDINDKAKEAQFSENDKKILIKQMKHCYEMTSLEKVLRRSIAKKAKSKNIEFLKYVFLRFDEDMDGSFSKEEFGLIFD